MNNNVLAIFICSTNPSLLFGYRLFITLSLFDKLDMSTFVIVNPFTYLISQTLFIFHNLYNAFSQLNTTIVTYKIVRWTDGNHKGRFFLNYGWNGIVYCGPSMALAICTFKLQDGY